MELYGTFHKKLNDVGWSTGGQHPVGQRSVNGQSAVGQRSVNGQSPGRVNVNTYVIITKSDSKEKSIVKQR